MYAKLKNGKIIDWVQGKRPDGYVDAELKVTRPTEYPVDFYTRESNKPSTYIQNGTPVVEFAYQIKSVDSVKSDIAARLKATRKEKQLGSFDFGGVEVVIDSRETSLIIASLIERDLRYKVKEGVWVNLTGAQVAQLKIKHADHVQAAYDWEESKTSELNTLTTYQQLVDFIEVLENE